MKNTAAGWLRLGEGALFLALLALGVVRAAATGVAWPAFVIAGLLLAAFGWGAYVLPRLSSTARIGWLIVLLALHAGLIMFSRDFLWLAFPLWMLAARAVPLLIGLVATAISLAAVITAFGLAGNSSTPAVLGPTVGALVAVGLARGVMRLEREAAEQRRLLGEVLRAQTEAAALADEVARAQRDAGMLAERTRLAHDIHDTLAQGFSSIVLLARAAGRETDPEAMRALVAEVEQTASQNLAESRRVVYALAPGTDALEGSLQRLVEDTRAATGTEVTLVIDPEMPRLGSRVEVALLRAAQSALANVRQHSGATRVAVTLSHGHGEARLDVVDDGRGFDPLRLPQTPTLEGGYGLRAMRERLTQLGGGLEVESEPGEGTALSAHLPLAAAAQSPESRGPA